MKQGDGNVVPSLGDQIEVQYTGVIRRGRVCYADHIQLLVKWDDGTSSSLRIDQEPFRITAAASEKPWQLAAEATLLTA